MRTLQEGMMGTQMPMAIAAIIDERREEVRKAKALAEEEACQENAREREMIQAERSKLLIAVGEELPDIVAYVHDDNSRPYEHGVGSALVVAFLGALAALFFQEQLDRVSQAAVRQPVMTTSIGLLTFVVLFIAAITIILLPVVLLSLIPLAFAWLFGVISIGQEIGDRFARAIRHNWTPVIATGVGTFVLVFIVASIQSLNSLAPFLACVTWVIPGPGRLPGDWRRGDHPVWCSAHSGSRVDGLHSTGRFRPGSPCILEKNPPCYNFSAPSSTGAERFYGGCMALKQIPVPDTIIHNAPPPLVEVKGTHGEMGCQIGEACREQVQHSIENAHLLIDQSYSMLELTWEGATIQSSR